MFSKLKIEKSPFLSLIHKYIATTLVVFIFILAGALACNICISFELAHYNYKTYQKAKLAPIVNEYKIATGDMFSKRAGSLGLSVEKTVEIVEGSKEVYDLAMIRAGNLIRTVFKPETSQFQRLEYEIDDENLLVVKQTANGLIANEIKVKYALELTKVSGVIESSLYETGIAVGLEDKVIMELADIFAWDIDFAADIQKGDTFEMLYEKRFKDGQYAGPGKVLAARFWNEGHDHWAVYYKDPDGKIDYYDLEGKCLRRQFLRSPLQYRYISSGYTGSRLHPILRRWMPHRCIDYAAPTGTPAVAAGAGKVIYVGWDNGYGKTVRIRHNSVYTTRYSHLSSYAKGIKYGARVNQGQVIGYVGSSGYSTGPHLEYAMLKYGTPVNPLLQKFPKVEPVREEYREDFEVQKDRLLEVLNSK